MDAKQQLIEILDFWKYKLDQNSCTMEEIESVTRLLADNLELDGTIGDFASFYGKSKDAVNSVIKRRMVRKPKRNVVLYPFRIFQKLIPNSWREKD